MGLFKAKKKEIEAFETDMDLPAFRIDSNGFVMFNDRSLGGAAVFEVIPFIHTEAITHEDAVFHNQSTRFYDDPDYEPSNNAMFGNSRNVVYPGWVHFLNCLQASDDSDEPTHIQILAKKCRTPEWYNKIDYAVYNAHRDFDSLIRARDIGPDPHAALLGARADDYMALLEHTKEIIDELPESVTDIRKLASYKTKFYLIISYTPSSEGWWMDGRDSDYYISDSSGSNVLFAKNEDKLVDRVTKMIGNKRDRKAARSSQANDNGAEDDFFWIETDRTAQVISTRIHKMMNNMKKWNMTHHDLPIPFDLVQMDGRETAALIRFFPNILTPYWDKIWQLQSDQNEVLYGKDVERAISIGDTSIIDQHELFQAIKDNTVDMRHNQVEQLAFLQKYKNKDYDDIATLESDHDDLLWTPELEEAEMQRAKEAAEYRSEADELWHDLDDAFALAEDLKNPAQKREDFLKRYKTRSIGSDDVFDSPKKKVARSGRPVPRDVKVMPDAGGITKTPGGYQGQRSLSMRDGSQKAMSREQQRAPQKADVRSQQTPVSQQNQARSQQPQVSQQAQTRSQQTQASQQRNQQQARAQKLQQQLQAQQARQAQQQDQAHQAQKASQAQQAQKASQAQKARQQGQPQQARQVQRTPQASQSQSPRRQNQSQQTKQMQPQKQQSSMADQNPKTSRPQSQANGNPQGLSRNERRR